jgi:hypothetical protein
VAHKRRATRKIARDAEAEKRRLMPRRGIFENDRQCSEQRTTKLSITSKREDSSSESSDKPACPCL